MRSTLCFAKMQQRWSTRSSRHATGHGSALYLEREHDSWSTQTRWLGTAMNAIVDGGWTPTGCLMHSPGGPVDKPGLDWSPPRVGGGSREIFFGIGQMHRSCHRQLLQKKQYQLATLGNE